MNDHIPVICITGGPCGGKTTVLSFLQQKLSDLGFSVVVVPEVATDFILSGITPDRIGVSQFQRHIVKHMIEKENRWKEMANLIRAEKKVIICDRGLADSLAYTTNLDFDLLLSEMDCSIVDLRDKRYDGVIFLQSVAVDAPEVYTCLNNLARRESIEEARELDLRTLYAWTGHPHLRIIDNSTDLDGKLHATLKAVCRILGVPAPLEIERKFLISRCDLTMLPRPSQQVHIIQYYLLNDPKEGIERIRARGHAGGYVYYHTKKQMLRDGVRIENERQITKAEYVELLKRADPACGRVEKTRYCFVWKNQYFELDIFENPQGLVLLELELTEEGDKVVLPDSLADYATDVTSDPRYSNSEIARQIVGI